MGKFNLKAKITSFLLKEDGKISKKNVLKVGIVLGAIALSSKLVKAGHVDYCQGPDKTVGDCTDVSAKLHSCATSQGAHSNAAHSNSLNAKSLFGRLVLGHNNCVETHSSHGQNITYHDSGGGGSCGSVCW